MRGGRDLGRADRQAQALKPPIVTKLQRMTEHQAQLALKSRSVAQVLAFGLAVEHQGPADQAEAGQGQAEPDTTTWTGCFPRSGPRSSRPVVTRVSTAPEEAAI